jgi:AbrB family looped-hinge helix DNA binding protein
MKTTAKVGKNGRAQIPYDVRMKLGIVAGDQLVVDILEIIHPGSGEIVHGEGHRQKQEVTA